MSQPEPPIPARPVRAAGSLLAHLVGAVAFLVALEVVLALAFGAPDLTVEAAAHARGVALAFALVGAVVLWAAPSLLPRRRAR